MAGRVPPHYSFPPPPLGRPRLALQLRQLRHIFYGGGIGGGISSGGEILSANGDKDELTHSVVDSRYFISTKKPHVFLYPCDQIWLTYFDTLFCPLF